MGIVGDFSESPEYNEMGLITGSAVATQFPSETGLMYRLKARSANNGSFFIGSDASRLFWELDAGDDTGWVAGELSNLWFNSTSGSADKLAYWVQR